MHVLDSLTRVVYNFSVTVTTISGKKPILPYMEINRTIWKSDGSPYTDYDLYVAEVSIDHEILRTYRQTHNIFRHYLTV